MAHLPEDEKLAREVVLSCTQFVLLEGILYHIQDDKTLRVVSPRDDREKIFQEAHARVFGAHLKTAKVHGELGRYFWWKGMSADIAEWCKSCLTCATRQLSNRAVRPPLTPIPVAGPFNRMGVDVIHFPKSHSGNQYAVVFIDYLTKWPEVFPVADQSALTIVKLLVEHMNGRHGVPTELLSDRGAAFLSTLLWEVCQVMGIHKVNTIYCLPSPDRWPGGAF